jgi:hypothetical protein
MISWFVCGIVGTWSMVLWYLKDVIGTHEVYFWTILCWILFSCFGYFTLLVAILTWMQAYKILDIPLFKINVKGKRT